MSVVKILAFLAVPVALSCSLIVGGEPEPMRCAMEGQVGPPACDAGFACISGICRPTPSLEDSSSGGGAHGLGGAAD